MESPKIITLYSNNQIQVKWDSVTGKIKVEPETEWLYPEGVDERVELCLSLCKEESTEELRKLVDNGHIVAATVEGD